MHPRASKSRKSRASYPAAFNEPPPPVTVATDVSRCARGSRFRLRRLRLADGDQIDDSAVLGDRIGDSSVVLRKTAAKRANLGRNGPVGFDQVFVAAQRDQRFVEHRIEHLAPDVILVLERKCRFRTG